MRPRAAISAIRSLGKGGEQTVMDHGTEKHRMLSSDTVYCPSYGEKAAAKVIGGFLRCCYCYGRVAPEPAPEPASKPREPAH